MASDTWKGSTFEYGEMSCIALGDTEENREPDVVGAVQVTRNDDGMSTAAGRPATLSAASGDIFGPTDGEPELNSGTDESRNVSCRPDVVRQTAAKRSVKHHVTSTAQEAELFAENFFEETNFNQSCNSNIQHFRDVRQRCPASDEHQPPRSDASKASQRTQQRARSSSTSSPILSQFSAGRDSLRRLSAFDDLLFEIYNRWHYGWGNSVDSDTYTDLTESDAFQGRSDSAHVGTDLEQKLSARHNRISMQIKGNNK